MAAAALTTTSSEVKAVSTEEFIRKEFIRSAFKEILTKFADTHEYLQLLRPRMNEIALEAIEKRPYSTDHREPKILYSFRTRLEGILRGGSTKEPNETATILIDEMLIEEQDQVMVPLMVEELQPLIIRLTNSKISSSQTAILGEKAISEDACTDLLREAVDTALSTSISSTTTELIKIITDTIQFTAGELPPERDISKLATPNLASKLITELDKIEIKKEISDAVFERHNDELRKKTRINLYLNDLGNADNNSANDEQRQFAESAARTTTKYDQDYGRAIRTAYPDFVKN